MHYLMLVTLTLAGDATSEEARSAVYDTLLHDDTFCGSGGRFGSSLCDWFVIGGRGSGLLPQTRYGEPYARAIDKLQSREADPDATQRRAEFEALWHQYGGLPPAPLHRESDQYGHEDDALLVDQALYDRLLAVHDGQALVSDSCHCEFVDLDDDPVAPWFVGRKWLVVVDYHS